MATIACVRPELAVPNTSYRKRAGFGNGGRVGGGGIRKAVLLACRESRGGQDLSEMSGFFERSECSGD